MNPASQQYVLDRLAEYFEYMTNYLRLTREGKLDLAGELMEEYETMLAKHAFEAAHPNSEKDK